MKRLAFVGLMLGMMAGAASAAPVEFRGAVCFTSFNAPCIAEGWVEGDCAFARFRPRNLGDNGPATRLSIFFLSFAENYTLTSGTPVGEVFKPVNGTNVGAGGGTFAAQMRFDSQAPPNPAAGTPFVNIVGFVRTFSGITNCTAEFREPSHAGLDDKGPIHPAGSAPASR